MTKNIIKQSMSVLLAVSMAFTALTGIPATKAQAATTKPVIKCSKVKIKNNSCTVKIGQKVNLTAKSGKTNVTKKGTWKSSKKTVATISKTGKLTAKKAGTTNVTVTYKKKTSTKLKVVVKKKATAATPTPQPTSTSTPKPTTTTKPVPGAHTITYNPNGGTLSGSNTQSVTGEILEFPKVKAPSGKKFIGWYDKKSGGNRIYETYVPTKATELFAHYVDEDQKTQVVKFVTECNYGGTYSFMGKDKNGVGFHVRDYDWLNKTRWSGPMYDNDEDNVTWSYNFELDSNNRITIDSLPTPEVPGYTFVGWYTVDQNWLKYQKEEGKKVEIGQKFDEVDPKHNTPLLLYARFSKKITISFDDFRGNEYDDIVVDSYKTITESGAELPVPEIPGAKFVGWTMDIQNRENTWLEPLVTNDSMFYNCIEWKGFSCSECMAVCKMWGGFDEYGNSLCEKDCNLHFLTWNDDWYVFEETDHVTLYPCYEYDEVKVTFDPMGGRFSNSYDDNHWFTQSVSGDYTKPVYLSSILGSQPYGGFLVPGHENAESIGNYVVKYGNGYNTFPVLSRDYYEFDGWYYKDDNGEEQEFKLETILEHDMDVYAKWKPGVSKVWFSVGLATGDSIPDDQMQELGMNSVHECEVTTESSFADIGKKFPIPVHRDGRKFLGWRIIGTDNEMFTEDMPIIGRVQLAAMWGSLPKDLPIKLDFDSNGGTFDDETFENNISGNRGTSFNTFPSVSKPDYDFLGWYVLKPGATDYNDDASFIQMVGKTLSIKNDMVDDLGDDDDDNDKVTLVARWKKKGHVTQVNVRRWLADEGKYVDLSEDDDPIEVTYTGANMYLPLDFLGVALPETVSNRNIIWSSSNPDLICIAGADDNGELELRPNWDTEDKFKFSKNELTPTKDGYDVVITATAADFDPDDPHPAKFDIKVHISFPEDQIPVTVTFDAGAYGKFDDDGKRYQSKEYDVKRSTNLMSIIGSETPVLDFENTECFDSHGAAKYEFIGWEVITANGDVIDVTNDMKASDFNGLDEIEVVAV